jgi:hypothetical protein
MMRVASVAVGVLVILAGGGGCASAAGPSTSSNFVPAMASDCGGSVSGQGFRVFACMSGGASVGHPHPKELLVVRGDRSFVAFPAFQVGKFAVGDGEVVATYDGDLVRVTSHRLVPLVTQEELSSALQSQTIFIWGLGHIRVDPRGDIYFFASTSIRGRYGCQNRSLERLSGGRIRQIWSSSSPPNNICY